MKKTVVGIGEILWDVFPNGKVLGGAPANFAYHASQLGLDGYAISAIGDDNLGDEIIESLDNKKLKYLIEKTNFATGTVQVTLNEKGEPQYQICENVAWDNIPYSEKTKQLAKNAQAVCFGSLSQRNHVSRTTILKFLAAMPHNSLKIFDINLRQHFYNKETIIESLQLSNMLKLNEDEVIIIAKMFDMEGINEEIVCNQLLEKYNLNTVILTKGSQGSHIFTPTEASYKPTPKVQVADTVGAGDAFTAAYTAAVMLGKSTIEAHELAVEVSAYVCTQHGAMPQLPDSFL